jgi:hypothetical protein
MQASMRVVTIYGKRPLASFDFQAVGNTNRPLGFPLDRRSVDLLGTALFVGTIFSRKRDGRMRAEVRFDGVAGCLRTPKGGSAKQIVITTRGGVLRMRWMSPREYARLQGADDFPLVGTTNQQLFGFGDAVCVPVIKWIDDRVLTPIAASLEPVRR